ncbi:MAG TPA: cytochrome c oxidase subunit II [Xanthobacteraceae bacterium]|jgi:cytochrome c oxidase subunit 2|nr:cytochrome c oxidase subunit II [Xanthobacteraceae bacterium]
MQVLSRLVGAAVAPAVLTIGLFGGGAAFAGDGQPSPWQLGFQPSATPVMEDIASFHDALLYVITAIAGFVLVLLLVIMVRFNRRANPNPSRVTHNTLIEVVWTVVPIMILTGIAIPSFKLLFYQQNIPQADLTVKATGNQWYWNYAYPDNGKFDFDSRMLDEKDRAKSKPNEPRLLAVDNDIVVPVNKVVRVQVTADAAGVIHSFAVPSFGIKIDAVPGRLNETWFQATREGTYYGQCSELCGRDHAFMPIVVRVVSDADFAKWVEEAKKKFARDEGAPMAVAAVPAAAAD